MAKNGTQLRTPPVETRTARSEQGDRSTDPTLRGVAVPTLTTAAEELTMDGFKLRHIPVLLVAGVANFFRPTPKLTRGEIEAKVDEWQADWIGGTSKPQAVDDIVWMIDRAR